MNVRYDFDLKESFGQGARLNYIIKLDCEEQGRPAMSTHSVTELVYVISGTGKSRVEDSEYPLARGAFYILNPLLNHGEYTQGGAQLRYLILGVSNVSFLAARNLYEPELLSDASPIPRLLERIFREAADRAPDWREAVGALFRLLLIEVNRSCRSETAPIRYRSPEDFSNRVQRFIDGNLTSNLSLDTLARTFYVHKSTLEHKFRRNVGMTVTEYILQQRVRYAKMWLFISNLTTTELASRAGFSSPSYFCACFKRATGLTPKAYKRELLAHPELGTAGPNPAPGDE